MRGRISGQAGYEALFPTTIHEVDINYSGVAEQFIGVIIVYRHFRRRWCGGRGQKFSRNSRPPDRLLSRAVISIH